MCKIFVISQKYHQNISVLLAIPTQLKAVIKVAHCFNVYKKFYRSEFI